MGILDDLEDSPAWLRPSIAGDAEDRERDPLARRKRMRLRLRYGSAIAACAAVTLVAWPLWSVIHPTNIAMLSLPAFQEWTRDGLAETLVIERFEQA